MTTTAPSSLPLFCRRNAEGHIVALHHSHALSEQEQQSGGWETVMPGDAEVDAFMREVSGQVNPLSQTDASLARVLEDLIDVLINRSVIQFTDLPEAARAKLFQRRQTRADLTHRLDLLPDEGEHGFL